MITFYLEIISFVITLSAIFVALKWERISWIPAALASRKYIPLLLLTIAIAVDAATYFIADYSGALYLGIMSLLAIPFTISTLRRK